MRRDFLADPSLAERYYVINAETGESIEDVAWADNETGVHAIIRRRPRTFTDAKDADLRIKSANGEWSLQIRVGAIEFVDRNVSPFKAEFMALLDDPDVAAKLRTITNTRDAG